MYNSDPSSSSRPQDHLTEHIHLDWDVSFAKLSITGSVVLSVKIMNYSAPLVLDCHKIDIVSVSEVVDVCCNDDTETNTTNTTNTTQENILTFMTFPSPTLVGGYVEIYGIKEKSSSKIKISYNTTSESSALQWIHGPEGPFLFSQCQAIHCRTMIPCQDTPQVKATFTATITTDIPLTSVMSANKRVEISTTKCTFQQSNPIPSYLIAIAVGNIESRDVSERCRVWAMPDQIEDARWEFGEMEDFLGIAEKIAGPYRWERYDLLILPPSFPYGGMENPCLTFVTPSLLAGDRSLVDVVAHEIAHSWTGNLVGCRNWEHFWLNEGWTMFLERRILSHHYGEDHRQFDSYLGAQDLKEAIRTFDSHPNATKLVPSLEGGVDPDDLFSVIPYEKGYTLLYVLEGLVGGPVTFDAFIKEYVKTFGGSSLDSGEFQKFTTEYFCDVKEITVFDWDLWLTGTGMPPIEPEYDQKLVVQSVTVAKSLLDGEIDSSRWNDLSSAQRVVCLDHILVVGDDGKNLDLEKISSLVKGCNVEVMLKFYLLCIKFLHTDEWVNAASFSARHGRMKYCRPILRNLYTSKDVLGKKIALESFAKNESFYHPIARQMIRKDLEL